MWAAGGSVSTVQAPYGTAQQYGGAAAGQQHAYSAYAQQAAYGQQAAAAYGQEAAGAYGQQQAYSQASYGQQQACGSVAGGPAMHMTASGVASQQQWGLAQQQPSMQGQTQQPQQQPPVAGQTQSWGVAAVPHGAMDTGMAQYGTATYSGAAMAQGYRGYGYQGGFGAAAQSQGHMLQQHQQQTQQQPPQWDGAAVQQGAEGSGRTGRWALWGTQKPDQTEAWYGTGGAVGSSSAAAAAWPANAAAGAGLAWQSSASGAWPSQGASGAWPSGNSSLNPNALEFVPGSTKASPLAMQQAAMHWQSWQHPAGHDFQALHDQNSLNTPGMQSSHWQPQPQPAQTPPAQQQPWQQLQQQQTSQQHSSQSQQQEPQQPLQVPHQQQQAASQPSAGQQVQLRLPVGSFGEEPSASSAREAEPETPATPSRLRSSTKAEHTAPSEPSPESQPGVAWVDGLVADGVEDRGGSPGERRVPSGASDMPLQQQNEESGVFKAGVPLSVVPDDGEWSIAAQAKAPESPVRAPAADTHAEAVSAVAAGTSVSKACGMAPCADTPAAAAWSAPAPAVDTLGSVGPWTSPAKATAPPVPDEPEPRVEPVAARRVAEAFVVEKREYGEMCVSLGDIVYAFESLVQNGWVYGYKRNGQDQVSDQGWLPASILVPQDVDLEDDDEEEENLRRAPLPAAVAEEGGAARNDDTAAAEAKDWKGPRRRSGRGGRGKGDPGAGANREAGADGGARPQRQQLRGDGSWRGGGSGGSGRGGADDRPSREAGREIGGRETSSRDANSREAGGASRDQAKGAERGVGAARGGGGSKGGRGGRGRRSPQS